MKPGNPPEEWPEKKRGVVVKVPSKRLDDIIYNKVKPNKLDGLESGSNPPDIDRVFALKVDTQGEKDDTCITICSFMRRFLSNNKKTYPL